MQILSLFLSPVDDTHMNVVPHSYGGSFLAALPYDGLASRRATILKALNVTSFDPTNFKSEDEQEWMVQVGLLDAKQKAFHPDMRANIGKVLFQTLFPPGSKTKVHLQNMIFVSESSYEQVLIQLEIEADVGQHARLFDYPWELLHDERDFLAARGIAISRYIAYEAPPPALLSVDRMNVLLISSTASDPAHHLDPLPEEERQAIVKSLQEAEKAGRIYLHELKPATFGGLRHYVRTHMRADTPYVLHFDGHGHFGKLCNSTFEGKECKEFHSGTIANECLRCGASLPGPEGHLLFEDDSGGFRYISTQEIGAMLGLANKDNERGRGIALVVLSACKSSLALMGDSVFNGVTQNLIAHQIPAVVGMAFSVSVEGAKAFADDFYLALSQEKSLAQAVNWGREAMGFESNQWYRPVLYLRWKDNEGGQMFATTVEHNQSSRDMDKNPGNIPTKAPVPYPLPAIKVPKLFSNFIGQTITYYREIEAKRNLLAGVSEIFQEEDIWPAQCRRANNSLQPMCNTFQQFADLLDSTAKLTKTDGKLRSALIIPINHSKDLLYQLIPLISSFSTFCQTPSREVMIRQQEIRHKLRDLEESLNEIGTRMAPFITDSQN